MSRRRSICIGLALVAILAAASAAPAQERGALTVLTNLNQRTATVGYLFQVKVTLNFQDVGSDKVIGIRLKAPYEEQNKTINSCLNERMARDWHNLGPRSGQFDVEFQVAFDKEIIPENRIQVDAYTRTRDGASQHFFADYLLKIKMIPRTTLKILSVDVPRPPDTVRVGENVPLRLHVERVSMLPETDIFCDIQAIEGGQGYWSWRSPKFSGSGRYESDPVQLQFDSPGLWRLRAKAKTENALSDPLEFEVEVVDAPLRVLGPVRIGYPEPPETVAPGERVRFDVSFDYKNFPAGTMAAVVFVDAATGKDMANAWLDSRLLSGDGRYDYGPITLTAPGTGTWEMDVTLRLPRIDKPGEYKTYFSKRISLQVKAEADPPANPAAMKATITKIQKPSGSLKVNEIPPLFITIQYEAFGDQGAVLRADLLERGTTIFAGRGDSILLRNQGAYTFPVIHVKMAHAGAFAVQVKIVGPNNRVLDTKWTDFTVVD